LTAPEDRAGLFHGQTIPAVDYLRALRIRRAGGRAMDDLLSRYDALVGPTYPHVASPIDQPFATYFDREQRHNLGGVGNLCGLPSITVPNGFGERGLPTGIEFLGRTYDEERILAAARALQARTDWHKQHPSY
jgi:aspartyl-tRNA(Asn)/glutamyl-tRNA(Gln) amidotransferase subunit A